MTRAVSRGLRAGAVLAAALPWLAPVAPAGLGAAICLAFLPACHHIAARTMSLCGAPMCVCSRCAGLYAGLALGFALPAAGLPYLRLFSAGLALTAAEVLVQDVGGIGLPHVVRLLSGAALGWVAAAWMVRSTVHARAEAAP